MTVASKEQTVVDAVPKGLYIGGEWRDAGGGGRSPVEDPATGEVIAEVADATLDDAMAALDAAADAQAEWARHAAARARRDPAPRLRADHRARRRPRAAHDARDGQAARRVEGRGRLRRGLLPLVRRGGDAHRRAATRSPRTARRRVLDDAAAGRPVPLHHAVELPAGDGHAQDRPGDRRRLHDGRQAGQADAAVDARARADPRGGRAARRRAERHHREVERARSWSR